LSRARAARRLTRCELSDATHTPPLPPQALDTAADVSGQRQMGFPGAAGCRERAAIPTDAAISPPVLLAVALVTPSGFANDTLLAETRGAKATMVLADLGKRISDALHKMQRSDVVDETVLKVRRAHRAVLEGRQTGASSACAPPRRGLNGAPCLGWGTLG
jgi:hypothetical protein